MDGYKRDLTQQLRGMGLSVSARPGQTLVQVNVVPGTSPHSVAQTLRLTAVDQQATTIYDLHCEMVQDHSAGRNFICVTCYI